MDLDVQRRDAILNAALKEFSLQGYDNASTNVIAKEAGISKPLMFHYVSNKQELFLFTYDYFNELLDKEYYSKMDYSIKDIFERLRTSYLLQIELIKRYPRIFDLNKLSSKTRSDEINKALESRESTKKTYEIFDMIDISNLERTLILKSVNSLFFGLILVLQIKFWTILEIQKTKIQITTILSQH